MHANNEDLNAKRIRSPTLGRNPKTQALETLKKKYIANNDNGTKIQQDAALLWPNALAETQHKKKNKTQE